MNLFYVDAPKSIRDEDHFQRYEFSKRIASVILNQNLEKSLVIGLYGKWGEGKSSVLNFIENELTSDTVIVRFNPWLYSDEQNLLKSFFYSIAESLDEKLEGSKEKIGKFLEDYSGIIGSFTQFAGFSTDGLKDFGNNLKTSSIEKVREKINQIILNSKKKIVVFIDDIDRLDVNEIQFVFKLVKLVADFPNTTHILAFDDELVANALSPKYAATSQHPGYLFLEKIIQIPLKIPKASISSLRKYTLDLVQNVLNNNNIVLKEREIADFVNYFDKGFVQHLDNPRLGVRFANSIAFSLPLLNGEVYLTDLMIVEGIKVFYPEFYDFMRVNPDLFLVSKRSRLGSINQSSPEFVKDQINKAIKNIYDTKKSGSLFELLYELFPQLEDLYRNFGYSDDAYKHWMVDKKICSSHHFNRYFSYVVQEGHISDVYFGKFMSLLENGSVSEIQEYFNNALDIYESSAFIMKIKFWENNLSSEQEMNLCRVIAITAKRLPITEDFRIATPFGMSAGIIAGFLFKIHSEIRLEKVLEILKSSQTLEFAIEVEDTLSYQNEKSVTEFKFSKQDEVVIQQLLLDRYKIELEHSVSPIILFDRNIFKIWTWWKQLSELEFTNHIAQELRKSKNAPLDILKVFVPTITSYGGKKSKTYKGSFMQKHYEEIAQLVDPQVVYETILDHYGLSTLEIELDQISERDSLDDETLVAVFQKLHEKNISL